MGQHSSYSHELANIFCDPWDTLAGIEVKYEECNIV